MHKGCQVRYLPYFVMTLTIMVSGNLRAHQILHDGFRQATLEDIQLWKDRYSCELKKIVEIDQDGRGTAATPENNELLELKIDKDELLVEQEGILISTGPIISMMGMHVSKAYGGKLIAHSNIGHMTLDKEGNFFWNWSAFNWEAGSTGIVFISGKCE